MSPVESLGLAGIESVHYYVRDLERMRAFLTEKLDFEEVGCSGPELEARGGQHSVLFRAGRIQIVVSTPKTPTCRASRWLRKHPEGVGTVVFVAKDIDRTAGLLEGRGGTLITDVETYKAGTGTFKTFNITTPFGDTTFRFIQREGTDLAFPGFVAYDKPRGGQNRFRFGQIDHVTSNFQTMKPALLWMEHVMGFRVYWDVAFHTTDVSQDKSKGSGLKSIVMYDDESGSKFANNEPARPFFKASQINLFGEDHRGDGVQHLAITVDDIVSTVRSLRDRQVAFMPTPASYYEALPERLNHLGIHTIDEAIPVLKDLEILVDGDKHHSYLLQIFLKEQAGLFADREAGPFFVEIIQRKGDNGFGAGNFRALFESIERDQQAAGRL